jgi:membrane-associated phospholipid phosphatase
LTRLRSSLLLLTALCLAAPLPAQDGSQATSGGLITPSPPAAARPLLFEERQVSPKLLIPNVLHHQKKIWLFPAELAKGKHVKPALGAFLVTAALVALDPHDTPYFARTETFSGFNRVFSSRNTSLAMGLFPASFLAVGLVRRGKYSQNTALLTGQAFLDTEIVTVALKSLTRRVRPRDIPLNGDYTHTWYKSDGAALSGGYGFPSGHAVFAFSLATIFAQRYRRHRWVPWVAYGFAGVVVFSRVTTRSHFPSDALAGSILGYSIGRYVVLRQP